MLSFVSTPIKRPDTRTAEERRRDFEEIYHRYTESKLAEQASRCSQCGVPFCQSGCPLGNDIPDWLRLAAEGQLKEAYEASTRTSTMPEICGRICPQDRLCEKACVLEQSGHDTVTIGAVEQYITDTAWENGWVPPIEPREERAESIGIIGAGPAGLAAADTLRELGYAITIYDRYDRAGGLLTYGIPNFKLDKSVVSRRVDRLKEAGVVFHLGVDIGNSTSFESLRAKHDAVLVAVGAYAARDLVIPGASAKGVVDALGYLTAAARVQLGDDVPAYTAGDLNAAGKSVVVVGGGDTAMDCVRTAVRQGATSVSCVYRRDRENMPGSQREVGYAEDEGVDFQWLSAPKEICTSNDEVSALRVARMRLGPPDTSGRRAPQEDRERPLTDLPATMVIKALGFEPEDVPSLFNDPRLAVTDYGTLSVNPETLETTVPRVFAAGDIVRGASLVVWAVRDGQVAAQSIHQMLRSSHADEAVPASQETIAEAS